MTRTTTSSLADFPDILHCVFAFLDPDLHLERNDAVYEFRQTLAASARTCSGFTGPALSVLWKRLPDDQPLADLLCALGIAVREIDARNEGFDDKNKPERYELPIWNLIDQLHWKQYRGYDNAYVSVMFTREYVGALYLTRLLVVFIQFERSSNASPLGSLRGVYYKGPRYHTFRL